MCRPTDWLGLGKLCVPARLKDRPREWQCILGRLLTQILEMRMIPQLFSHQSSGAVKDRLPVAISLSLLT
jgi:hypothetical protein